MKKQITKTLAIASLIGSSYLAKSQAPTTSFASIQVIHNSPDAAATTVDIYAGTTLLIDDLSFRHASQTFTNITAGTDIVIGVAPGTSTSSAQSIATFTANFAANSNNIIVADGLISATGYTPGIGTAGFTLNTYTAGLLAAPNGTTTSLLVHHGSTDAPTVDVVAPFTGAVPVIPNALVNNASYGDFSNYLDLPTANYKIQVRDQNSENVVAEYSAPLSALNLDGAALTVVASGFLNPANNSNGPAFGLYVASVTGGSLIPLPSTTVTSTRLQAIHNSADLAAAQVDVYLQSASTGTAAIKIIDNFAFRTASPYIDVPVGEVVTLSISSPTSTSAAGAIATFTYNLASSSKYQLIASGLVSTSGYAPSSTVTPFSLRAYASARERATNTNNTDLLVFHGSTDAPTVDIVAPFTGSVPVIPNILVNNASFGGFSNYLELPTANYKIQVRDQNSENVVAEYSAPLSTLNLDGAALTVVASGFLTPSNNSNGAAFGLYVASATGGSLIPLPSSTVTSTRLQAIHNSADLAAAQVDVYLQSASTGTAAIKIIDNFAFRTASPYIDVPVGEVVTLSIAAPTSTSSASPIATFTYNLASSSKYQLIASGLVSATGYSPSATAAPFGLRAYASARERSTNANNTDVLVFHGATDAPIVDVQAQGAGTIVNDIAYGAFNAAGYLELATNTTAGNFTLHVTNAAGTATVASYGAPLNTLGTTGLGLTVLASGFLDPTVNSTGPAFGLFAALPAGGALIPLPVLNLTTSLNEKTSELTNVILAPNPANDFTTVKINSLTSEESTITVSDVNGKVVLTLNPTLIVGDNTINISLSDLTNGIYFINVNHGNKTEYGKIIKF
jgi:hypothetical protein